MKLWRIESLRGLLVLYVTIGHLTHSPFLLLRLGQEAVVTFFLISGFVIEASFIRAPFKSFLTYITARAARIYPPLILLFFIVYLIHSHTSGPIPTLSQVVGNMLMLQDSVSLKPDVITAPLFSGPIWSLHYEWWFYISYYPASLFFTQGIPTTFPRNIRINSSTNVRHTAHVFSKNSNILTDFLARRRNGTGLFFQKKGPSSRHCANYDIHHYFIAINVPRRTP
jgi:peptidoglycan/LPS O-acetylase OafA/YrhL